MWKLAGKYPTIGGRFVQPRTNAVLRFRQRGTTFPDSHYASHDINVYSTSFIEIISNDPNRITIDFGDGTINAYEFEAYQGSYIFSMSHLDERGLTREGTYPYHQYAGTFGDEHHALPEHIVSLSFDAPDSIREIFISLIPIYGIFPSDVGKMSGLQRLALTFSDEITDFPAAFGTNTSINNLRLRSIGPVMEDRIPDEFFSLPLERFEISESVDLSDPISSNFARINDLKDTLNVFIAISCQIVDCPPELAECVNMTSLNIMGNRFTECPPEVNSLINLEALSFAYVNPNLTGWGGFSACTKLITVNIHSNTNGGFPTDLPPWLNQLTAWKSCQCFATFGQSQARTDTWVNNVFDFVVANALITGTSVDPFRSMNFDMSLPVGHPHYPFTKRPSGTYQQPAGYVQGNSNGTPASPMERIWVLTNQYDHTWTVIA